MVELFGRTVSVDDIRPVTHADLLGRREIDIDLAAVAGYLRGPAGAGHRRRRLDRLGAVPPGRPVRPGPAGHAGPRRVRRCTPCSCRWTAGRCSTTATSSSPTSATRQRLDEVFAEHRPQVVFHAAALKHLPLLEMHPSEALKTNVFGTYQILQTALRHGVDRFVNISTDKAADPISVLGYSKRITERLTAARRRVRRTGTYLQRPVRQRAGQPRLGADRVRRRRSRRAARSPSPTPRSPASS